MRILGNWVRSYSFICNIIPNLNYYFVHLKKTNAYILLPTKTNKRAGKSLCYQLPPLYLNQVAIVISPLISLMEDQVSKLNGRSGQSEIATFLGSSQSNPSMEQRALSGEFRLVYVTPEKLTCDGFLDSLAYMHSSTAKICVFAVDESHCVSQWGHDFRPSFLKIGPSLRGHKVLSSIPILALTATAVPRVQLDIVKNLQLKPDATQSKKSFDRPNLKIVIRRKPRNARAFDSLTKEIAMAIVKQGGSSTLSSKSKINISGMSTIVYCATKKEVEEIAARIISDLGHEIVRQYGLVNDGKEDNDNTISIQSANQLASNFVKPYHAGMSFGHRSDAHTEFLIGKVTVIVATVAFGKVHRTPIFRCFLHLYISKTMLPLLLLTLYRVQGWGLTNQISVVSYIGEHVRLWKNTISKWEEREGMAYLLNVQCLPMRRTLPSIMTTSTSGVSVEKRKLAHFVQ